MPSCETALPGVREARGTRAMGWRKREKPRATVAGFPRMQTFAESEPATLSPSAPASSNPSVRWGVSLAAERPRSSVYTCACVLAYPPALRSHVLVYTAVCHSQVLAKYARPFVSDLLFWRGRHSTLAAENRIKCFCLVLSLHLSVPFFILRSCRASAFVLSLSLS